MRRSWVLPAVILVVLLLAGAFRWHEVASKSTDSAVYKWKQDRWTGEVWTERFTQLTYDEHPALTKDEPFAWKVRWAFSFGWTALTAFAAVLVVVKSKRPKKQKGESL